MVCCRICYFFFLKNVGLQKVYSSYFLYSCFVDQVSKVYIKLNFAIGEHIDVFSWFKIYFIENNGMAFGMEFIGNCFLQSSVSLQYPALPILFIAHKKKTKEQDIFFAFRYYWLVLPEIFSIRYLRCAFFSEKLWNGNNLLPETGGYARLFMEKWLICFIFPIIKMLQETIFSPIFNIADSAITIAVAIILIFSAKT